MFGVRFIEERSEFGEPVDMEPDSGLLFFCEGEIPVTNLRFDFDFTPRHSVHAISSEWFRCLRAHGCDLWWWLHADWFPGGCFAGTGAGLFEFVAGGGVFVGDGGELVDGVR